MAKSAPTALATYPTFLKELRQRIAQARIRSGMAANVELLRLYWSIGRDLQQRIEREAWGAGVMDRLTRDLGRSFPGVAGFSRRNLYRMIAFFRAYPDESVFVPPPVAPTTGGKTPAIVPPSVAQLPWAHHVELIERVKDPAIRQWYAQQAIAHGWSRDVLGTMIRSDVYGRSGTATTNFAATLPAPQSDLAQATIKDPYTFDFLAMAADAGERQLEQGLVDHVQQFLLAMGVGFAFVGRQVKVEVGEETFFIDLLFYHLHLRCFVVVELKAGTFKPGDAGQINFYLNAVDAQMRHPDDKPSIGLILCRSRNRMIAEYALRGIQRPVGVAEWQTKLVESLPKEWVGQLPTVADIEAEFTDESSQPAPPKRRTSRTRSSP